MPDWQILQIKSKKENNFWNNCQNGQRIGKNTPSGCQAQSHKYLSRSSWKDKCLGQRERREKEISFYLNSR